MSTTRPALPDVREAPDPIVRGEPVELAEGVYVIPDRRVPLVPNVGIVVGQRAALVIDTGLGPRNGDYVLAQARALAGDRPLYLTITHFHPEHGFGAQSFRGQATIVYNQAQRDELRRKGAGFRQMFSGFTPAIAAELKDVEFVDPDIVYSGDQAELDLGGHLAVLRGCGPAHSVGDQTILIDDQVLFTGDLVETRMFPIAAYFPPLDTDVDLGRWIGVLGELLAFKPKIVVPGHGEHADAALITRIRDYFVHIRGEVARLSADGRSLAEVTEVIEAMARERWSDWDNPNWIAFTVGAFYREAQAGR